MLPAAVPSVCAELLSEAVLPDAGWPLPSSAEDEALFAAAAVLSEAVLPLTAAAAVLSEAVLPLAAAPLSAADVLLSAADAVEAASCSCVGAALAADTAEDPLSAADVPDFPAGEEPCCFRSRTLRIIFLYFTHSSGAGQYFSRKAEKRRKRQGSDPCLQEQCFRRRKETGV